MSRKLSKVLIGIVFLIVVLVAATFFALPKSWHASEASAQISNASVTASLSDFRFTKVGNTHYSVALTNKAVTEAIIPSEYNGLPVKEIASSGFGNCTQLREIRIPHSVKTVGINAFVNDSNLTTVTMTGVETIGQNAFAYCSSLETVTFPDTLVSVGANVFRNSAPTVYTNLEINNTAVWTSWYNSFTGDVIDGYNDLVTNYYDDGMGNVGYSVSSGQFVNSTLYYIDFHDDGVNGRLPIVNIEPFAFENNNNEIGALAIGFYSTHTINIEYFAFMQSKVESVFFNDNVVFSDIGYIFSYSPVVRVVLPSTLTEIPPYMFEYCTELESVSYIGATSTDNRLPPFVTFIGDGAFSWCEKLDDLRIPSGVAEIGGAAFEFWNNTSKIYVANDESAVNWSAGWDANCDATVIYDVIFTSYVLEKILNDTAYRIVSGGYFKYASHVAIPETYNNKPVVEIGDNAFINCANLVSVSMPSITKIRFFAFGFCTSLENIYAPEAVFLGSHAFAGCEGLTQISFPKVTTLEDGVFKHCEGLLTLDMSRDLPLITVLDGSCFIYCISLTTVILNGSLTTIRGGTFTYCEALATVDISESVTTIEWGAFSECFNLTTVYVRSDYSAIPTLVGYPFDLNNALTIYVPDDGISLDAYKAAWPIYAHLIFVTP